MIDIIISVFALFAVLVLAYFLIRGGAALNGLKNRNGAIKITETMPVGARERVIVMNYNNQRFLLGVTAQSISVLDQHDWKAYEAETGSNTPITNS